MQDDFGFFIWLHHILQFVVMVKTALVDGIAFDEVLFEDGGCPTAKVRTSKTFNAITNRNDYVKVVIIEFGCLCFIHN